MPSRRAPKHIVAEIRKARSVAMFENAGFGFPGETVIVRNGDGETSVAVDEFVKERTQLYRET